MRKMTGNQYKAAITELGLNQGTAADFLDISLRSSANYAAGTAAVPRPIQMLLAIMIRHKITPDKALAL